MLGPMNEILGTGLGESQRFILERLKRRGEVTLADLESEVTLARETLRSHLKSLAAQGLVERAGVVREGPGRPQVRYRLSEAGETLFPRREAVLLGELVRFLLEHGERDTLERFFAERVARKREALRLRVASLEGSERLREVARILSADGFMAEVEERATESPRLRLCHCPLRELVAVSHLPCRAEMELVGELVESPLRRESFMPDGDSSCTYSLAGVPSPGLAPPPAAD
jgi:predicted ArsR family transcriptional regulator